MGSIILGSYNEISYLKTLANSSYHFMPEVRKFDYMIKNNYKQGVLEVETLINT
jgi:hypothetical protein